MEQAERLESSLTEEGRYRLLVEAVTDYAIYMLDPAGTVASWNPGARRFKGYEASEILGQHFSRFYTEEDKATGLPARALQTAATEGKFESEGWRVRKDGSRFWAYVIIDPIRDTRGHIVGYAKVTRDLTERKEAQEALERAREALFQSQKMEAVGQLTGGLAHDFNNLLAAMLGSLEMLRKRVPEDPKVQALLENAVAAGRRGAALTQRMLAFARRQRLELAPVALPALVGGIGELLQRSVGPQVEIHTQFPLVLRPALTDPNQLELALLNLVVNARDAMPQGGAITIAARQEDVRPGQGRLSPGRYVCLSVIDTGDGMDEQTLMRAAEPFFTTKGVGKGTGLGLSMVHGIAEQSGGCLMLHSRKGEGATAEIWLPVADAKPLPEGPEEPQRAAPPSPSSLTILAVDDDPLVLMNTASMLEDMGHSVLTASSGAEALQIFQRVAIDLVITDQAMPRMTGVQLAKAIRAESPKMPLILATGYAELPAGVDAQAQILNKPFWEKDLAEALVKAVAVPQS
ncbi:PAS domain-containing sensor histidine kinase [Aurantimonas sp. VKM B-3413]|uniref:PAS domain-containing sensor histidine kinase n=1 Tax=Aurantimonas sp. VKM B-3413 TaxID=2779401 RepID=UPI001E3C0678|nr:PAS domain-containing sensor histidine kinase [Aurantimonas sp. VKM B-3413]MCB8839425.1 PAS domain S-box protein [Aurantimonas sp. VKM B-3413]